MLKKSVTVIISVLVVVLAVIFIYRYQILQYTSEAFIRQNLPGYVKIDSMKFDFRKGEAFLGGVKILNPAGFSKEYLIEISRVTCRYKLKGKTLFDGLELFDSVISGAVLDIERLDDGRLNLSEAGALIAKKTSRASSKKKADYSAPAQNSGMVPAPPQAPEKSNPGELIKLPENFRIKDAKILFIDSFVRSKPRMITFEDINGDVNVMMDEHYTRILALDTTGEGNINGDMGQVLKWKIALDTTTPRLTMANRFDVTDVAITPFEPYYDKYSPLVFKAGRVSGLFIFDFNNGAIGSSNELRLSGIKFHVKQGYENAVFWETTVPDIVKYFTTSYGEIVLDFKIKGDMSDPKFFLGPRSKEALVSMAVDKISAAIAENADGGGKAKDDIEKMKGYIDLFKQLTKK
ncbi:MAG: DUF748 domain-containing protein [Candidatus Omnitrophota bacterium]